MKIRRAFLPVTAALTSACSGATDPGTGSSTPDLPIALISSPDTNALHAQVVLASVDGRTTRTLVTFDGPKGRIRWSPDGRRLAFLGVPSNAAGANGLQLLLWVVNADGTGLQQLTRSGYADPLAWLADGRLVYLRAPSGAGDTSGPFGWLAVPAGGGAAVPITVGSDQAPRPLSAYQLDISRDGTQIVFPSTDGASGGATLYAARLDGSSPRAVGQGLFPRWAPAADRIASSVSGVVISRADGSGAPTRIPSPSDPAGAQSFTWSPDASRLAWIAVVPDTSGRVYRYRAETARTDGSTTAALLVQRPATATDADFDVDWRPTPAP